MDDLPIGEYIRTYNKGIKRIDHININKPVNRYCCFAFYDDDGDKCYTIIKTTEIKKHSNNMLDLLEVGDIIEVKRGLYGSEVIHIKDEDTLISLKETLKYTTILKVLAHELFDKECYKVGD